MEAYTADAHVRILAASMGFMAVLTFLSLFVMFRRRVKALKAEEIRVSQFKTYESEGSMPALIVQASRHYTNLFEMPTLFYVVVLFSLWSRGGDWILSSLAILFCGLRAFHTFVHLGSNNVFHRMRAFAGSILALAAMWVYAFGKFFL